MVKLLQQTKKYKKVGGFLLNTELFDLEGASQEYVVQSSLLKQGPVKAPGCVPRSVSSQVLNMSKDWDSTTF